MIKNKNKLLQSFLCCISIIFSTFLISCEKKPDQIGLGILPGDDNFQVRTDTVYDIFANTVKLDSILTFYPDTAFVVYNPSILADYTDPLFGQSQSSLLVNFFPDSINPNFGTNPELDSLVLFLSYDSVYGDKNANVQFRISELNQALSHRTQYFSNIDTVRFKGRLLADSIIQFKDTLLKIKITGSRNPEFISSLFNVPASARTSLVQFQEYFKGLYLDIKAITYPGVFVYVNPWLYSSYSKLSLYYKNSEKDSLRFNYYMLKNTTRVNRFSHNYANTPIETVLQNNELSQKITYVQGIGGLGTKISIPELAKWADEAPVSINKAELSIPVYTSSELDSANYPSRLSIMAVPKNGDSYSYIEYGFGQTFIGGVFDAEKNVYTFNLAKHLQKIANSKFLGTNVENTDLIIVADGYKPGQKNSFSKVALDFSAGKGAKLSIIYSKQ